MGIKEDICFSSGGELFSIFENTENNIFEKAEEIRIRCLKPLKIKCQEKDIYISPEGKAVSLEKAFLPKADTMTQMLNALSSYSPYSYKDFMTMGFITIKGGHRAGLSGRGVWETGQIKAIKDISSINIRIARENKKCGEKIIEYISESGFIHNTAIISPPGMGKTTLLRDIARRISDMGKNVSVIDERSEICALYKGIPQLDIGENTDVIDSFPKDKGIFSALRSLSPHVIVCDEVGGDSDIEAINKACFCGVSIICTLHGKNSEDAADRLKEAYRCFDVFIFIEKDSNGKRVGRICDRYGKIKGEVYL